MLVGNDAIEWSFLIVVHANQVSDRVLAMTLLMTTRGLIFETENESRNATENVLENLVVVDPDLGALFGQCWGTPECVVHRG
ncbi:hypothetical protein RRSWK_03113 [Rhodopirellula sp. SWK7]|nr:hypothetical protein RRSWK_03113 [Rhodopirellula sp. SWK7]